MNIELYDVVKSILNDLDTVNNEVFCYSHLLSRESFGDDECRIALDASYDATCKISSLWNKYNELRSVIENFSNK